VYGFEYKAGFDDAVGHSILPLFGVFFRHHVLSGMMHHSRRLYAPLLLPCGSCLQNIPQYVSWINDNAIAWTLKSGGVAADTLVEISARPVPQEPMVSLNPYSSCSAG
jgi:hypothetical protein